MRTAAGQHRVPCPELGRYLLSSLPGERWGAAPGGGGWPPTPSLPPQPLLESRLDKRVTAELRGGSRPVGLARGVGHSPIPRGLWRRQGDGQEGSWGRLAGPGRRGRAAGAGWSKDGPLAAPQDGGAQEAQGGGHRPPGGRGLQVSSTCPRPGHWGLAGGAAERVCAVRKPRRVHAHLCGPVPCLDPRLQTWAGEADTS